MPEDAGPGHGPSIDFSVPSLGPRRHPSPMLAGFRTGSPETVFFTDARREVFDTDWDRIEELMRRGGDVPTLELAGPRRELYWSPADVRAAIVTAGGLCPGINNVVRALVLTLFWHYGVEDVIGLRYGLRGFTAEDSPPMPLTPEQVRHIHRQGGSFLGSSRGGPPVDAIIDFLARERVALLFMIGGDGAQRSVLSISRAARARGVAVSIIGIPKTIDNDILFVDRTFGFTTAVDLARDVVDAAHAEAQGAFNGIGLVRLMGRNSGFITAHAALASGEANIVLVPEVPFEMDGPRGFLACLERRIRDRRHALVVVAEGAGQQFLEKEREALGADESGNERLADIGAFLTERIRRHFQSVRVPIALKFIDPGYTIRSATAGGYDAIYCQRLAQSAVHAAMAGKTEMLVGRVHGRIVHVPSREVVKDRKRIDPDRQLWRAVLQSTGQPAKMFD